MVLKLHLIQRLALYMLQVSLLLTKSLLLCVAGDQLLPMIVLYQEQYCFKSQRYIVTHLYRLLVGKVNHHIQRYQVVSLILKQQALITSRQQIRQIAQ